MELLSTQRSGIATNGTCTILEMLIYTFEHSEDIIHVIEKMVDLAEKVTISNSISEIFDSVRNQVKRMTIEERDLRDRQRQCIMALARAETKARTFVEKVRRLFDQAELNKEQAHSMKESYRSGTGRIVSYVEQIKKNLEQSQRAYFKFRENYDEAIDLCGTIAKECDDKRKEACSLKVKSGVASGVTAVASVAAEVMTALAVAVKPPTGPKLVVGLVVAGVIAAGVGVVGVTIAIAHAVNFWKLEKSFRDIRDDLDRQRDCLDDVSSSMDSLNDILETTSDDTDDVVERLTRDFDDFCTVFDMLLKGVLSARQHLTDQHPKTL